MPKNSILGRNWPDVTHQQITRRHALVLVGVAAGTAVLTGCAATQVTEPKSTLRLDVPDPNITIRGESIAPKDTDAAIDTALEPHYVVAPVAPVRGQLFLFLPSTAAVPSSFHHLADQGARNGFHVVVLRYPNSDTIQSLCGTDPDLACFENTRLEIINGTDRSAKVNVNRANSIENRLVKLLAFLQSKYPNEGWSAFVEAGAPRWGSIVVAGHSQGGAHAALIARDHVVVRVAMLSAPVDHVGPVGRQVGSSTPAAWLLGAHATPSQRYYAFGHARDENNDWELQWKALGLGLGTFGPIANVDTGGPPYGGSHQLTTNAAPRSAPGNLPYHQSTAIDAFTALTSASQPLFAPVWQYVCFA